MKADSTKILIIMDGFGKPLDKKRSAITKENTKYLQYLKENYANGLLNASEDSVGLPTGQTGTSDVGHLTIGTGRVIQKPLVKINTDIENKSFFKNPAILKAIENAKQNNKALHLLGIPTDGGVHGHINHLLALIELCSQHKLKKVYIHFFADGRDTPQVSALKYYDKVQECIDKFNCGEIVSVIGRFYALDRDNNWDRVEQAYNLMVNGQGEKFSDLKQGINSMYAQSFTDEFLPAIVKVDKNNNPVAKIETNDSVIIYNYRADRERQLAYVLSDDNNLNYTKKLNLTICTMTEYDKSFRNVLVAYKDQPNKNILSEVLSNRGYTQLKIAETEKYAYVTFAFNDGRNEPYLNEDRQLVASEKMKLYSAKPQMSAYQIADIAIQAINKQIYDCIILNFANCDMVGHSGDMVAAKIAVQVVDECVQKICEAAEKVDAELVITADHGNADIMQYQDGSPHTAHTINLVPVFLVGKRFEKGRCNITGTLADVAPTLLKMLGENIPKEMTGTPLF